MNALVGYTGFVGSNIYAKGKFEYVFNSKNIDKAYGLRPDLLIYAGLRAEKYLANISPEQDMELIYQAEKNINKINPKKLVLISTVDVLKQSVGMDESVVVDTDGLHAYGLNRYWLECRVRENYPQAVIIRLPGLFGINIKKNFIYDYINIIPSMLKEDKFMELLSKNGNLKQFYSLQKSGFYKCKVLNQREKRYLKQIFQSIGFSAIYFTDSRNSYQFYPLERLWDDIQICLSNGISLWHCATEPINVSELYEFLEKKKFVNEIVQIPIHYDFRTKYASLFEGKNGYILNKLQIMNSIAEFVKNSLSS